MREREREREREKEREREREREREYPLFEGGHVCPHRSVTASASSA